MEVKPYNDSDSKKEQVREMFDSIAPKYDLLNHLLSMNIDRSWRNKLVRMVEEQKPATILDLATGTADLAILMSEKLSGVKITGADLSPEMVAIGKQKVERRGMKNIELQVEDAEKMSFTDQAFDAVTISFGVRNFENIKAGLSEMNRILTTGGKVYVLEFSMPRNKIFLALYKFYFRNILPVIGKIISKDVRAYKYLPESVEAFPYVDKFLEILKETGFKNPVQRALTMGIATIYTAEK